MSFIVGTIAGALVAGGIYHEFSTVINSRTNQHCTDLHALSQRLNQPTQALIAAPPPAADRIAHHPFSSLVKSKWNRQIENVYVGVREWDHRASEWGWKILHGTDGVSATQRRS